MLKKAFDDAIRSTAEYASSLYLYLISANLGQIDKCADDGDRIASQYRSRLMALCSCPGFALDAEKLKDFSEIFGESHFYCYCKENAIQLARISERANESTPDFHLHGNESVTFEVKTLSIVNGSVGLRAEMAQSLEANISLEEQINDGAALAVAYSGSSPFGQRVTEGEEVSGIIYEIYAKITNSLKADQFRSKNSFLVVNLLYLYPGPIPPGCSIVPVGMIPGIPTPVTGPLWTVAFGLKGNHIHGMPKFEGLPAIERIHHYNGLLVKSGDPDELGYDYLSGIFFMTYTLKGDLHVSGLFRSEDLSGWHETDPGVHETLVAIANGLWNTDLNEHGHALLAI